MFFLGNIQVNVRDNRIVLTLHSKRATGHYACLRWDFPCRIRVDSANVFNSVLEAYRRLSRFSDESGLETSEAMAFRKALMEKIIRAQIIQNEHIRQRLSLLKGGLIVFCFSETDVEGRYWGRVGFSPHIIAVRVKTGLGKFTRK